jgi:hypothetical protein
VVCPNECDREASITSTPWPTRGCCAIEKENGTTRNRNSFRRRKVPYHTGILTMDHGTAKKVSANDRFSLCPDSV